VPLLHSSEKSWMHLLHIDRVSSLLFAQCSCFGRATQDNVRLFVSRKKRMGVNDKYSCAPFEVVCATVGLVPLSHSSMSHFHSLSSASTDNAEGRHAWPMGLPFSTASTARRTLPTRTSAPALVVTAAAAIRSEHTPEITSKAAFSTGLLMPRNAAPRSSRRALSASLHR